jgi:hypothetical protein
MNIEDIINGPKNIKRKELYKQGISNCCFWITKSHEDMMEDLICARPLQKGKSWCNIHWKKAEEPEE